MTMTQKLSIDEARKVLLYSQGLLNPKPVKEDLLVESVGEVCKQLSYIQIDSISVIERAHHHVLHSRIPNYKPELLNGALNQENGVFEYWSHAAAYLPMSDFRMSLFAKARLKQGPQLWFSRDDETLARILKEVEQRGPLSSRDLKDNSHNSKGWWNWKPAKKALEQLFLQGDLMVVQRKGMEKILDLSTRVIPDLNSYTIPTQAEFVQYLLGNAIRQLGIFKPSEVLYQRPKAFKKDLEKLIAKGIETRGIIEVEIENNQADSDLTGPYYANPDLIQCALSSRLNTKKIHILSPFDNLLIQRKRFKVFFGMDYQIECYVPKAKRIYGYFTLPVLRGTRAIGRIDCKVHRKEKDLEVLSFHNEGNLKPNDLELLRKEMQTFQKFQACETTTWPQDLNACDRL